MAGAARRGHQGATLSRPGRALRRPACCGLKARKGISMPDWQSNFARALCDPGLPVPEGVIAHDSERPKERFAIYRNNRMVGLLSALEARFPATSKLVREEFFKAATRRFIVEEPPR